MKDVVYITGHKNPDSDSICSAIAYAELKNKTESISAVPVRLGELNKETKFILDYFDIKTPELINTVKTQISDLDIDNAIPISSDASLKMALDMMKKYEVKTLPVVDENNCLLGVVTLSNLTSNYMDVWDNYILSKSGTKLENILYTLSGKIIYAKNESLNINGKIIVAALDVKDITSLLEPRDIVICGNREDSQISCIENGASLLVITGNHTVKDNILKLAKEKGCSIISTPYDTFTTSRLIMQSIPVQYVMTKDNLTKFNTDDFLDDIKDIMLETRHRDYPVTDKDNKIIGTIARYHLISKNKKKVILMDHNEKSQSVHGLDEAEVLEIIDHHRIADIQTSLPIYFRNQPVGSTSTIVASMFFENGIRPSKKIAGVLCAAIISDTLFLKSPTSTTMDEVMINRLSYIANINPEEFSKEMFKAGTSLEGRTPEQIFNQDFKAFNINNYKIGVSQINTMCIESFDPIKKDILNLMNDICNKDNYNLLVLMVTDILNNGSKLVVVGPDKDLVEIAFNVKLEDSCVYLQDVLSRKKQIIPPITSAINSIKQ